jgi:hypothetical protein
MALSHSFTGEHIEDRGDKKADANRDHPDIEHDGSAPFKPSDARRLAETRVRTCQLLKKDLPALNFETDRARVK